MIADLVDLSNRYYAALGKHFPEFGEALRAADDIKAIIAKHRSANGGHLLYRPVGITIVTNLVCQVNRRNPKLSVERCVQKAAAIPILLNEKPYRDVLWDHRTSKMRPKGKKIIIDLLAHELGLPSEPSYKRSVEEYEALTKVAEKK